MAGFFDSFLNRLVPGDQFSRDDKKGLLSRGLLEAGLTALATPTGTGSGLMGVSRGLLGGLGGVREGAQDMEQGRMRQAMFGQQQAEADAKKAQLAQQARIAELQRAAFNPDGTVNPQGMAMFRAEFPMEAITFNKAADPQEQLPAAVREALYFAENPAALATYQQMYSAKNPTTLQWVPGMGAGYDGRTNTFVSAPGGGGGSAPPAAPPQPSPGALQPPSVDDAIANIELTEGPLDPQVKAELRRQMLAGGNVDVPAGPAATTPPPRMNPIVMANDAPLTVVGPARAWWTTATPEQRQEYLDRESGAAPAISSARPTEDMSKAAGWLSQAQLAVQNMKAAISADPEANQATITERIAGVVPFAGDILERGVQSAPRQQYVNAASSLSEAVLRAATGAGVNADEAAQKVRELTPQIGDKPETIQQKMVMAENYLRALEARAGAAAIDSPGAAPQPPNVGEVKNGYRYIGGDPAQQMSWEKV